MLHHGGLPEVLNPYLIKLIEDTGGVDGPIGRQFVAKPEEENAYLSQTDEASDPLLEEEHEVAPGLVYKYEGGEDTEGSYYGRVLFTITRNCAAYCRYCTRGREVGIPKNMQGPHEGALSHTPHLSKEQIDESLNFIRSHPEINEVILSGGDPMTVNPIVLDYVLTTLGDMQRNGELDFVRIGTRFPIHFPEGIKEHHYAAVEKLVNPRLMIHVNHASELTPEALSVLTRFRKQCDAVVMTQSVLLHGVNDNVDVLTELFNKAAKYGMIPYYVYQNDPVNWAKHFTVPPQEAYDLWQKLRPRLSGIAATARLVIDTPGGYGKIPLPEGDAWNVDINQGYKDFKGQKKDFS